MAKQNILHKAKLQKAEKAIAAGKLNDAGKILTQLCTKDANNTEAWLLLASVYGRLNNFQGVAECSNKVLALKPSDATALIYSGNAYTATKQYEKAADFYERFFHNNKGDISTLYNLAMVYFQLSRINESINILNQITQLKPKHFNAINLLHEIHKEDYVLATEYSKTLTTLQPDNLKLLFELAHHYMSLLQTDNAKRTLLKCLKLTDTPCNIYISLADNELNGNQGNHLDEAEKFIKLAIKSDINSTQAKIAEANIWFKQGNSNKAKERLKEIITQGNIDYKSLIIYSSLFSQLNFDDYIVKQGKLLLNKSGKLLNNESIKLHYCLGRILDKSKKYKEAFSHYQKANSLENITYDPDLRTQKTDDTIHAHTEENLKQLNTSSIKSDLPIFVLGMPRTGTTLVEQILATHTNIYGAGELIEIGNINETLLSSLLDYNGKKHGHAKDLSVKQINTLTQHYLDKLNSFSPEALRITDKMPHNSLLLGFIAQLFPQSKIIYCSRHPLDTILSIYFQHFTHAYDYTFKLESIAHYYLEHEKLMTYWKESLDIPIYEVPYDNLIHDFENTCHELIEFTGLEWQEQCLNFHESKRSVNTPSHDQVNRKIYTSSIDRWKNYEEFLAPLKPYFPELLS